MSSALAEGGANGSQSSGMGQSGAGGTATGTGGSQQASQGGGTGQAGSNSGGGAGATGGQSGGSSGQGATASWRDTLPEDIRGNPTLSKYSDITNLAKAHIAAQEMIGKKGIIKPAPNSSPEEWRAFREALGVPSADKYDVPQPKGFEFPKET